MDELRTWTLLVATITTGLITGVFALYAHTVMPALRATDDRTFVAAFQALDRAIVNPWFMLTGFLGAAVFTSAAAVTHRGRPTWPWVAVALAAYAVAFVVTVAVHVPLNDAVKAAGDPAVLGDVSAARRQLHEVRWVAWNLVRVVASGMSFVLLAYGLVVHGHSTAR